MKKKTACRMQAVKNLVHAASLTLFLCHTSAAIRAVAVLYMSRHI